MALALVLIFRSTGIVNFAQGEMAMFSTFVAWGLYEGGVPLGLAVLTTLALSFVAGWCIERGLIRHFEGGEHLTLVIVTLGLFILLNSLAGWIWGFGNRSFPSLFSDDTVTSGVSGSSVESLGIVGVLLGVVGLLFLLFQRTKSASPCARPRSTPTRARSSACASGSMLMLGWGLAAALGALAGVLVAPRLFLDVNLMGSVLIYAFAAAALGGFDSAIGAVVGGWIIGVSENLAGTYVDFIGADLKILVPLGIIFVVLLVRPSGLFGAREVAERERAAQASARSSRRWSRSRLAIPFLFGPYRVGQFTLVLAYAVAVLGLNLLVGYNGQISLGHGAFFALGAYTAALLIEKGSVPLSVDAAGGGGALLRRGYLFGIPALRLRGLYLALVTLGLAIAMPQLIKRFDELTEGTQGLTVAQPTAPAGSARRTTSSSTCSAGGRRRDVRGGLEPDARSVGRTMKRVRDGEIPASRWESTWPPPRRACSP